MDAGSSALNRDCNNGDLLALGVVLLCKDNTGKGDRRGLRPWPLRCLSQCISERKERLLRGQMFLRMSFRTFHRRGGLVFIVDVRPVGE